MQTSLQSYRWLDDDGAVLEVLYVSQIEGERGPLLRLRYNYLELFEILKIKITSSKKADRKPRSIRFNRIVKTFHPCPKMNMFTAFYVLEHLLASRSGIMNQLCALITDCQIGVLSYPFSGESSKIHAFKRKYLGYSCFYFRGGIDNGSETPTEL